MEQKPLKAPFRRAWSVAACLLGLGWSVRLCAQEPIRISEVTARKAVVTSANPEYPALAKQMHVFGQVVVEAEVDTAGNVGNVRPLKGNTILGAAAVQAVQKWK